MTLLNRKFIYCIKIHKKIMDYYDDCEYEPSVDVSDEDSASEEDSGEESSEDESDCENSEHEDEPVEEEDDECDDEELSEDSEKNYIGFNFMTKFEKTRILGIRTEQIIAGAKIFVETTEKDPFKIACMELEQRRMPLKIRRYFGKKYVDVDVNDKKFIIV